MITAILSLALASFTSDNYTVVNPAYNEQGTQMVMSVNMETGKQLWFTEKQYGNLKNLQSGDMVQGVFNDRYWNEDEFFVFKK